MYTYNPLRVTDATRSASASISGMQQLLTPAAFLMLAPNVADNESTKIREGKKEFRTDLTTDTSKLSVSECFLQCRCSLIPLCLAMLQS